MFFIQSLGITALAYVGLLQSLKTYTALVVLWPRKTDQDKKRPDKARRVSTGFENWCMYPGVCKVMFLCMVWYDIYVGLCIADNNIKPGYISLAAS